MCGLGLARALASPAWARRWRKCPGRRRRSAAWSIRARCDFARLPSVVARAKLEACMQGKVVVVTGAFGILGKAAVARAKELGATVAQIDFAPAPAGADSLAQGGIDLSKAESAKQAIDVVK